MYFGNFRKIAYSLDKKYFKSVTDIMSRVKIRDGILDNITLYNKYDVKIDIRSRDIYSWSNSSSADLEKPANDFVDFIKQQSFDYVLYLVFFSSFL